MRSEYAAAAWQERKSKLAARAIAGKLGYGQPSC